MGQAEDTHTATRLRLRRSLGRRSQRLALWTIAGLIAICALADFLAADLPIACYRRGQLELFANVTQATRLRADDNRQLLRSLGPDDWAIFPLSLWGPNAHDLDAVLAAPSRSHWLGTDSSGRDVFARVVHGTRVSLTVGILSVALAVCAGLWVGMLAGYSGGVADALLMRVVDVVHSVPTLLLLVTLLTLLRPTGYANVLAMSAAIGCVRWTDLARLTRAETLRARVSPYIEAARSLGLTPWQIAANHLLPNVLSPLLVAASFSMAGAIAIEGALSFLGFGVPIDIASWGSLLNDARAHAAAWWLAVFPGLMLFVTVSAYNLLGEGLRDAIDPTLEI